MIFLNGNLIEPTLFPDNTSQVWKIAPRWRRLNRNIVKWEFSNEGEFLQLAQLKMLLDRWDNKADLIISYLPYGRQDKVVSNFNTFALHTFCKLLNTLNFKSVLLKDPHSDLPVHLINNCFAEYYLVEAMDTFGFALKSTACIIKGVEKQIYKDPKTDDGIKKSQKGKVIVTESESGQIKHTDGWSLNDFHRRDLLRVIFKDGEAHNVEGFSLLRKRLSAYRY